MTGRDFLKVNLRLLRYWGCYPPLDSSSATVRLLYNIYTSLSLLIIAWLLIGSILDTYNKFHLNMSEYALNIINIGAYNCALLTVLFCVLTANRAKGLINEIQQLFKYQTENYLKNKNMKGFERFNVVFTYTFSCFLTFSTITMAVLPLFGDLSKLKLPVCSWSPIDLARSYAFPIAYLLQIYGQIILGGICAAVDSFFVSMVAIVAAEFTLIGCEFNNCVYNTLIDIGISNTRLINFEKSFKNTNTIELDINLQNIISTKKFNDDLNVHLIPMIQNHIRLLNFARKIENHFWSLIFMKIITSLFYHVFMGFIMATAENSSLIFGVAQYEACALLELLIFATVGQFLMTRSQDVSNYVYESPWYLCSKSHLTSLNMIMLRSNRICKLSIGKLSDLTLPAFLTIMRTALSYLAVLRQVTRE